MILVQESGPATFEAGRAPVEEVPCRGCGTFRRGDPKKLCRDCARRPSPTPRPLADRLWEKVDRNGPTMPGMTTRCEVFVGARHEKGYGVIAACDAPGAPSSRVKAHVAAFFVAEGRWPTPRCLHHCDNPPCVRRDHLFEGTPLDNMRDMIAKGRQKWFGGHPETARWGHK